MCEYVDAAVKVLSELGSGWKRFGGNERQWKKGG